MNKLTMQDRIFPEDHLVVEMWEDGSGNALVIMGNSEVPMDQESFAASRESMEQLRDFLIANL